MRPDDRYFFFLHFFTAEAVPFFAFLHFFFGTGVGVGVDCGGAGVVIVKAWLALLTGLPRLS